MEGGIHSIQLPAYKARCLLLEIKTLELIEGKFLRAIFIFDTIVFYLSFISPSQWWCIWACEYIQHDFFKPWFQHDKRSFQRKHVTNNYNLKNFVSYKMKTVRLTSLPVDNEINKCRNVCNVCVCLSQNSPCTKVSNSWT